MRWNALVLVAVVACIEPAIVVCDNGTSCPAGTLCDLAHHSCALPDQFAACTNVADQALCTTSTITNGACHDGVCLPIACGNGLVDPGEVCDDGNTIQGDGCAADCTSTEACGNNVIDLIHGEQCDDGNLRSHDGCDSRCRPEALAWRPMQQVVPQPRKYGTSAYDPRRRRLVVFGGAGFLEDTLEWDGSAWRDVSPVLSPPSRQFASAVFDEAHDVVVMFGGFDGSQYLGDTWTWDGRLWTEMSPAVAPSPRHSTAMAYDPVHHVVVLFGGYDSLERDDTWTWDGKQWTQLTPKTSPPATMRHAMAFDPIRGNTVMVGGSTGVTTGDTWLWDGDTWMPGPALGVAGAPTVRADAGLAFDPVRNCLVSAGSRVDAWCWDGQWTQISTMDPGQSTAAVWFDRVHGAILEWAGQATNGLATAQMSKLASNGTWSVVTPDAGPPTNAHALIAYDARRARVVFLAGTTTWESDGGAWQLQHPTGPQPPLFDSFGESITYDARRGKIVVVGDASTVWEYDGAAWTSISPATHPTVADSAAIAYDAAIGKVVLFGGEDLNAMSALASTWTWDGAAWVDITTATHPGGRLSPMMAYDAARDELVLFGGRSGGSGQATYDETWVWTPNDGWVMRTSPVTPAARKLAAMTYDSVRHEILMWGGSSRYAIFADLWRWNGAAWTRLGVALGPAINDGCQFAYDAAREQSILACDVTWSLRWTSETPDDACTVAVDRDGDGLAGCADPDCAAWCTTCGNGVADPAETCRLCTADVGACTPSCGDGLCDTGETSCLGDCAP